MNCTECRELLTAGLEGLLDDSQKQVIKEHLRTCRACQAELRELQILRQRLSDNRKVYVQGGVEDDVMNRIMREQSERLKSATQAGAGVRIGRLVMKNTMVRLAIAAAVVLAAIGGISLWTGTKSGVALADVLIKVEQVQAFMYKMTVHMKGNTLGVTLPETNAEVSVLIANEYGMRMDVRSTDPNGAQNLVSQLYMLPAQKQTVMLMPTLKQYTRMEFDDEMFEKGRRENNDPRLMLKKILKCQYTDLGKTVIDGVEVQGFQTTDPAYAGGMGDVVDVKVWVNAKTELPVRMDMKVKRNEQMEMEGTLHDFQWDVPASAAEFNPVIPPDFTAGPGDGMRMPAMTEETAIKGLELCRELSDRYPDDLNPTTLVQVTTDGFRSDQLPALPKPPERPASTASDEEMEKWSSKVDKWRSEVDKQHEGIEKSLAKMKRVIGDDMQSQMTNMMSIQSLALFYGTLAQDHKEPMYYGKIVKPGDTVLVLMRWKTGENEYRVIFGDLHATTVNADTLTKLEAALPK